MINCHKTNKYSNHSTEFILTEMVFISVVLLMDELFL